MIRIPKGKQLRIRQNKGNVAGDIPLILEEDITISLSSSFEPLFGGGSTKLLNILGAGFAYLTQGGLAFSGQFKQVGFQTWTSTDPLAFSATLGFYMGSTDANDAKVEVYDPMIKLMSLTLPEEGGVGGSLIGPGPSVFEALKDDRKGKKTSYRIISLEIGRIMRINSIIIKRAEPTFNNETDENGFPISGKLQLDINSLFSATVEMITNRNFEPTLDEKLSIIENR